MSVSIEKDEKCTTKKVANESFLLVHIKRNVFQQF
jgi:hypothetical protein